MLLDNANGDSIKDAQMRQELDYLYKRLSTVNNLIRTLEQYDLDRPKPRQLPREKSA